MNELTDNDIREALRRREARRVKTDVPADFCDNVMQEIAPKPRIMGTVLPITATLRRRIRRTVPVILAAACIALAVLMVWPTDGGQQYDGSALAVRQERTHSTTGAHSQPDTVALSVVPKQVAQVRAKKQAPQPVPANTSDVDSLDYYINKIERELASVDDSLYIERIHRVMHADERLQRIVNSYIVNELHRDAKSSEANHINNVTTDDYEE